MKGLGFKPQPPQKKKTKYSILSQKKIESYVPKIFMAQLIHIYT